jgi:two-component system sensor histidine kinase BarA
MGGEINMKSRLHKGSTFWFNLRLHKTDLPVSQHLDISQLQGQRILLIEPNRQAAAVLQQQLSFAGLQVTYRSTLPERMVQHDYALLCLSPGPQPPISSLLAQIQHIQMHSKHCVVSLPSTELALSEQLLNSGIDACIGKPLSPRKLYEALLSHRPQQLLSSPAPESETPKLPLRVLAVDDNPANLKLIAALLQERVEQVYRASSGRQALQLAQDHSFDLIFMDIQMPEMDGVTTLKQLRQLKRHGQTPVIAVTAHAMAGERERLLAEGMDDYLTKPIEEAILEQTLIRWGGQMDPATPSLTTLTIEQPTAPAPVRSTRLIDWPLALRQAAGKGDLAREMLSMLIDFVPQVQQEIERALKDLNTADGQALTAIIHKLHGSCAYSGAPRVKALCATLETALKSGQTLPQLEPELSELVDELKNLCKAAPEYLQQHTAQHPH